MKYFHSSTYFILICFLSSLHLSLAFYSNILRISSSSSAFSIISSSFSCFFIPTFFIFFFFSKSLFLFRDYDMKYFHSSTYFILICFLSSFHLSLAFFIPTFFDFFLLLQLLNSYFLSSSLHLSLAFYSNILADFFFFSFVKFLVILFKLFRDYDMKYFHSSTYFILICFLSSLHLSLAFYSNILADFSSSSAVKFLVKLFKLFRDYDMKYFHSSTYFILICFLSSLHLSLAFLFQHFADFSSSSARISSSSAVKFLVILFKLFVYEYFHSSIFSFLFVFYSYFFLFISFFSLAFFPTFFGFLLLQLFLSSLHLSLAFLFQHFSGFSSSSAVKFLVILFKLFRDYDMKYFHSSTYFILISFLSSLHLSLAFYSNILFFSSSSAFSIISSCFLLLFIPIFLISSSSSAVKFLVKLFNFLSSLHLSLAFYSNILADFFFFFSFFYHLFIFLLLFYSNILAVSSSSSAVKFLVKLFKLFRDYDMKYFHSSTYFILISFLSSLHLSLAFYSNILRISSSSAFFIYHLFFIIFSLLFYSNILDGFLHFSSSVFYHVKFLFSNLFLADFFFFFHSFSSSFSCFLFQHFSGFLLLQLFLSSHHLSLAFYSNIFRDFLSSSLFQHSFYDMKYFHSSTYFILIFSIISSSSFFAFLFQHFIFFLLLQLVSIYLSIYLSIYVILFNSNFIHIYLSIYLSNFIHIYLILFISKFIHIYQSIYLSI
ncbi:unnamed protein product [Acanthosepion pharaonis]|uniref:Uncharacterized protein n=1 Tax=Acanthosepion pharaonis TaxID=158019 RepID=A0A812ANY8_ACAPH|nr:unnamed protein product [Sepia pharaonis]